MASFFSFVLGLGGGSVLALLIWLELASVRRQKRAAERRERHLRAIVHALEEQVDALNEREAERLMSTQWLPREVVGEVYA